MVTGKMALRRNVDAGNSPRTKGKKEKVKKLSSRKASEGHQRRRSKKRSRTKRGTEDRKNVAMALI